MMLEILVSREANSNRPCRWHKKTAAAAAAAVDIPNGEICHPKLRAGEPGLLFIFYFDRQIPRGEGNQFISSNSNVDGR